MRVGDTVLLRLPRPAPIPADSALGKKRETIRTQRLTVSEIIPAEGLGRFGLRPTQHLPLNAYVPLDWLQERLDQPGRANAILAGDREGEQPRQSPPSDLAWHPQLADYGLDVRIARRWATGTSLPTACCSDPAAERAILDALSRVRETHHENEEPVRFTHPTIQPALTYLANTLACNGREIPYSTITAIDFAAEPPLGPFLSAEGKPLPPLGPDEIALNSWAAEQPCTPRSATPCG